MHVRAASGRGGKDKAGSRAAAWPAEAANRPVPAPHSRKADSGRTPPHPQPGANPSGSHERQAQYFTAPTLLATLTEAEFRSPQGRTNRTSMAAPWPAATAPCSILSTGYFNPPHFPCLKGRISGEVRSKSFITCS